MANWFGSLSNIFFFLLFLQVAPSLFKDLHKKYSGLLEPKSKVGLIHIKDNLTSSGAYTRNLRKCFEDKDIKAILIKMECPGGYAGTAQSVFNEIKTLKAQYPKPIITLVENIAASGGYYIASATDYIIAPASAFIGSIGAYVAFPQVKQFIEKYNIKYDIIKSGAYKASGSPFLDLTPEQRKQLQSLTDSSYNQFTKDVQNSRPGLSSDSKLWADGKIFTGDQALSLKLIDELGSFSNAVSKLKKLATIEKEIEWVKPAKSSNFITNLFSSDSDDDETDPESSSSLQSIANTLCKTVEDRYTTPRVKY
ncbi:signal peptide peptidase SppA [Candidatus Dependentiae bacterium]|nr:signal peptide peptidase SppA [Candidatus Dependentiae bacterium]